MDTATGKVMIIPIWIKSLKLAASDEKSMVRGTLPSSDDVISITPTPTRCPWQRATLTRLTWTHVEQVERD